MGGIHIGYPIGKVKINFTPSQQQGLTVSGSALVLNQVVGDLPQRVLPPGPTDLTYGLKLADPDFHLPGPIDLLLGATVFTQTQNGSPYLVNFLCINTL